jgi:hypothetical protein
MASTHTVTSGSKAYGSLHPTPYNTPAGITKSTSARNHRFSRDWRDTLPTHLGRRTMARICSPKVKITKAPNSQPIQLYEETGGAGSPNIKLMSPVFSFWDHVDIGIKPF